MEKNFLNYIKEKKNKLVEGVKNTFAPCTSQLNRKNTKGDWKNLFLKTSCVVMATLTLTSSELSTVDAAYRGDNVAYSAQGSMPSQNIDNIWGQNIINTINHVTKTTQKGTTTLTSRAPTNTKTTAPYTTTTGTTLAPTTTTESTTTTTTTTTTAPTTTTTTAPIENTPFSIWTYNILTERTDSSREKIHSWDNRKLYITHQIEEANPDIICFQEITVDMNKDLQKALPEYGAILEKKTSSDSGSHLATYYNKERFEVIDSGKFWLSDTPNQESTSFGTDKRICAWVKFHDKVDNTQFYVYNIHYTYKAADKEARKKSTELINASSATLDAPVILLGDFNATYTEPAYQLLETQYMDSLKLAKNIIDQGNTYNGFNPSKYGNHKPIDHIWLSTNSSGKPEFIVDSYAVEDDYTEEFLAQYGNIAAADAERPIAQSDHYAVSAVVQLDPKTAEISVSSNKTTKVPTRTTTSLELTTVPPTTVTTGPLDITTKKKTSSSAKNTTPTLER